MKRKMPIGIILSVILLCISSCKGFLTEYSQDLTRPRTPQDLHEIFFGGSDGYIPSLEIKYHSPSTVGCFLNIMDDDVSMVDGPASLRNNNDMDQFVFGYYTWQMEVGLSFNKNVHAHDDYLWKDFYHRINSMNIIIASMNKVRIQSDEEKKMSHQVLGEAHFLRAQLYFILTNLYANPYSPDSASRTTGIPIKLSEYVEHQKGKEVQFPRLPLDKVYDVIIQDLKTSIKEFSLLPEQSSNIHIATLGAAQLLLSRVYLYIQDWKNAKSLSSAFLEQHQTLATMGSIGEDDIFINSSNKEIIFSQGSLSLQGTHFIGSDIGSLCVSSDLYKLYSDNDYRKSAYFKQSYSDDSIALKKYDLTIRKAEVSDLYLLRTAEGYLNKAESEAMLGNDAQARQSLDELRQTRYSHFQPLDGTYIGDKLINEIRNERRRELCFEGQRWFDLRRYSTIATHPFTKTIHHSFISFDSNNREERLDKLTYSLEPHDAGYTLAIPKSVISFDPKMINNIRPERKGASEKESLSKEVENTDN